MFMSGRLQGRLVPSKRVFGQGLGEFGVPGLLGSLGSCSQFRRPPSQQALNKLCKSVVVDKITY